MEAIKTPALPSSLQTDREDRTKLLWTPSVAADSLVHLTTQGSEVLGPQGPPLDMDHLVPLLATMPNRRGDVDNPFLHSHQCACYTYLARIHTSTHIS